MRKSASRGLRVAAGTAIGGIGLGIAALATSGSAFAASGPTGTQGTSINQPVAVSASIPTSITLTLPNSAIPFGSITPGTSVTKPIGSTASSNDSAGYATWMSGVNDASGVLGANTNVMCNENLPYTAPAGSTQGTATTTYAPTGGISRAVGFTSNNINAAGSLAGTPNINYYANLTTVQGNGLPVEVYDASLSGNYPGASGNMVAVPVLNASSPAFNNGLVAINCASFDSISPTGAYVVDNIQPTALTWGNISVAGTASAGTITGAPSTPFVLNAAAGSITNQTGGGTTQTFTLATNPILVDSNSSVSGVAGGTGLQQDTLTDSLTVAAPSNQAAGSYMGAFDLSIWGN